MSGRRAAGPALKAANLALLAMWPAAWTAPMARTALTSWFEGDAVSILGAVAALSESAPVLAALVALFGLAIPYAKTLALTAIQFRIFSPRALPVVDALGKLSMADVFLVAVTIVVVKGVGVGTLTPAWGLYLFTACVLFSMLLSHLTGKALAARRGGRA